MKKNNSLLLVLCAAMVLPFFLGSCDKNKKTDEVTDPFDSELSSNQERIPVDTLMSPTQSKQYLMETGQDLLNTFNAADQEDVFDLVESIERKFEAYEWDATAFETYAEDNFDLGLFLKKSVMADPVYMVSGRRSPMEEIVYPYGFPNLSAVFEANDATHTFEYKGKSDDNSLIVRMNSGRNTVCEAKCWGEGDVRTYKYTFYAGEKSEDRYAHISRMVYSESDGKSVENDGCIFVHVGENHGSYERNNTSYSGPYDEKSMYHRESLYDFVGEGKGDYDKKTLKDAKWSYVEYNKYEYNAEGEYVKYTHYYTDYDERPFAGAEARTIQVDMPEMIKFTLTEGNQTIISSDQKFDFVENDHYNMSAAYRFLNMTWAQKFEITHESTSANLLMKYGNKELISFKLQVPSYKVAKREDSEVYSEYGERVAKDWEDMIQSIGDVNAEIDLDCRVQIKANISKMGELYDAYNDWMDKYETELGDDMSNKAATELKALYNKYCLAGMYYNSDILQAKMEFETYDTGDGEGGEYNIEPVIMFPSDNTTYSYGQYFSEKRFGSLIDLTEDVINSYIRVIDYIDVDEVKLH